VNSWFAAPARHSKAKLRLFCFPYAGGGTEAFHRWADAIVPEVELLTLQLPGRGARFTEPPVTSLDALVPKLAESILPYLDHPFVFLGHSNGALIAFELARVLQSYRVQAPQHVILCAKRAPQLPPSSEPMHTLPRAEFIMQLKKYGGITHDILESEDLMETLLPMLRADFALSETHSYRAGSRLHCDVTLFGSVEDEHVPEPDLLAWSSNIRGQIAYKAFPGGHFFIHEHRKEVIAAVNEILQGLMHPVPATE